MVSGSFNSVWIDGLFFQLRGKGGGGKLWRHLLNIPEFQI